MWCWNVEPSVRIHWAWTIIKEIWDSKCSSIVICTLTDIQWTLMTQMPCTRWAKVASICWGHWGLLGFRGHYSEHFMTLWMNKLVRTASSEMDCPLDSIYQVGEWVEDVGQADISQGQHFSPPATRLRWPWEALSAADSYTRHRRSFIPQFKYYLSNHFPLTLFSCIYLIFSLISFYLTLCAMLGVARCKSNYCNALLFAVMQ